MLTPASFANLEIIGVIAFVVPLLMDVLHIRLLPLVVVEILVGVLVGPSVLHFVRADMVVQIFSSLGLAFLLFLAGMEVNIKQLRGPLLALAGVSFLLTFFFSLLVAILLHQIGLVINPLFIAIVLTSSAVGVIMPAIKATGLANTPYGQVVIMGATLGEFGSILLFSAFFTTIQISQLWHLVLLVIFAVAAITLYAVVLHAERSRRITALLVRLQDSTAQVRIRGAWVFLAAFVVLAQALGQTMILGAFVAGMLLRIIDPDESTRHAEFRTKLDAVGYGVFIPIFFIATGVQLNLAALVASSRALLLVPVILLALLAIHVLAMLLSTGLTQRTGSAPSAQATHSRRQARQPLTLRSTLSAGIFQATSLTFILAVAQIGVAEGIVLPATSAALTTVGMLTGLCVPVLALLLVQYERQPVGTGSVLANVEPVAVAEVEATLGPETPTPATLTAPATETPPTSDIPAAT